MLFLSERGTTLAQKCFFDARPFLQKRRYIRKKLQYFFMVHCIPLSRVEYRAGRSGPKIFANSLPKAGTNLLSGLLRRMPNVAGRWTYHIDETILGPARQLTKGKRGQVITAHMPWSEDTDRILAKEKFTRFLMIRDPRDMVVSGCHYVTEMDRSHVLHDFFSSLESDDKRLLEYIRGVKEENFPDGHRPPAWEDLDLSNFLPWLSDSATLVVRFEHLVGVKGGGTNKSQFATLREIAAHLGLETEGKWLDELSADIFSESSRTFRKGKIGGWREVFRFEHKQVFKERYGDLLIKLGYETDDKW